ncbi:hypothetical protein [Deinococcus yavapaiensis]|uniref:Uncharacterized protein n=1 Tax=Deinococcus yavapaiensis KR-236 TaxID=694435 RepID=A0A318S8A0_9DEIO|nr:hypothetical protein [Deinococcus yavapaiensis]PYE51852.1 hypothetical protein DES52_11453 [Deinococcus yavapaiensis KR-236]
MNYAATLAVLMVLAFVYPILVRSAGQYGVGQSAATLTLLMLAAFGFAVWAIRSRVTTHRVMLERLVNARASLERAPQDPGAFYAAGEHVGYLLLRLGRRREAAELIDRYARLGSARESEILSLREALARAERHRRRRT